MVGSLAPPVLIFLLGKTLNPNVSISYSWNCLFQIGSLGLMEGCELQSQLNGVGERNSVKGLSINLMLYVYYFMYAADVETGWFVYVCVRHDRWSLSVCALLSRVRVPKQQISYGWYHNLLISLGLHLIGLLLICDTDIYTYDCTWHIHKGRKKQCKGNTLTHTHTQTIWFLSLILV